MPDAAYCVFFEGNAEQKKLEGDLKTIVEKLLFLDVINLLTTLVKDL